MVQVLLKLLIGLGLELLVDDVEADSVSGALHLGDQVGELLDGLDLLLEVLALEVVGQLGILVLRGHLVNLEEGLEEENQYESLVVI